MSDKITVSNGHELYRIDPEDLEEARADGFYRPLERGQTVVGNQRSYFEIPIVDLPSAIRSGFTESIAEERQAWNGHQNGNGKRNGNNERNGNGKPDQVSEVVPATDDQFRVASESPALVTVSADQLVAELSQSEMEEQQRQEEAEKELSAASGWRWYATWMRFWYQARRDSLLRQLRGTGISAAVHVALILILASLILNQDQEPKGLVLTSAPAADRMIDEVIIEPTPLEITEPEETVEQESPAEAEVVKAEAVATPDFMGAIKGDAIKPPSRPASSGTGKAEPLKRASFFGKRVAAVNYVFVIDNSNSMTGGRFETALNELMIAVNQLTPRQRFYVLFYSDTAYPMFHPTPANQLIPATPANKELLRRWLTTVQLCLKTNGKEAITAAFALNPDVIFVLGDGAFTDGASKYFAGMPQNKIPLHTLGMEVKEKDAKLFEQLALAHGGTYKDVGVAPGALQISKQNPRPRNNTRGPIWGLTLKPK